MKHFITAIILNQRRKKKLHSNTHTHKQSWIKRKYWEFFISEIWNKKNKKNVDSNISYVNGMNAIWYIDIWRVCYYYPMFMFYFAVTFAKIYALLGLWVEHPCENYRNKRKWVYWSRKLGFCITIEWMRKEEKEKKRNEEVDKKMNTATL